MDYTFKDEVFPQEDKSKITIRLVIPFSHTGKPCKVLELYSSPEGIMISGAYDGTSFGKLFYNPKLYHRAFKKKSNAIKAFNRLCELYGPRVGNV